MTIEKGSQIEFASEFDIENFFNYQNPHHEEYQRLQQRLSRTGDFGHTKTEFADYWESIVEGIERNEQHPYAEFTPEERRQIEDYLQRKLQGHVLIDLGCGGAVLEYSGAPVVRLAQKFDVSRYVGIDAKTEISHTKLGAGPNRLHHFDKGYYIEDDMLLRLSRTPSDSANLTINGIDSSIIRDPAYNDALVAELVRVCRPEGIIFGVNSSVLGILGNESSRRNTKIRELKFITDPKPWKARFFEKISE